MTIGTAARGRHAEHETFRGGVRKAELPGGQEVWVVSGYDEVAGLLADSRLSLDKRNSGGGYTGFGLPAALDRNLLNMDGDTHGRVRRLAAPAFSRRSAESLRSAVNRITASVFEALPDKDSDAVDLMEKLCTPVPALVIAELLGAPSDLYAGMREVANAMMTFDARSKSSGQRLMAAIGWCTTTITELVAAKREQSGDDLLSSWIRARDDEDRLSEDELVSLAFLLLLAGLENAALLTGELIAALLETEDRRTIIADWPNRRAELIERHNPLPFAIRRFAVTDLTFGEHTIPKGGTVLLSLFGADSDPARNGRPSLMFGRGPHYCLGAQVTDLIVDAVVPAFCTRYPDARLAIPAADLVYRESWRSHGLAELPVRLSAQPI
ncbi:cytochrome P450 [Nocardia arthritidis]|uniref:Cytochrome P450 n=1 Tax=Nocardia arthritidis TaxID=228602 RepID=A0A6G9Y8M1_9NOCA|nr:cytochrome P450 [Nocardia arthritidis]QIS09494.1 cytochrome P450 [Nocardia arthritidis]